MRSFFLATLMLITHGTTYAGSIDCEQFAAVVGRTPINSTLYEKILSKAKTLPESVYRIGPVNGGRYWVRADYGDGIKPTPYPHVGCFADLRVAIAWACMADDSYLRDRGSCRWRGSARVLVAKQLPADGCVPLGIELREPVMYCAPGHSPKID